MWGGKKTGETKKRGLLASAASAPFRGAWHVVRHPIKTTILGLQLAAVIAVGWFFLHPTINAKYLALNEAASGILYRADEYLQAQRPENDLHIQAAVIEKIDANLLFFAKGDGDADTFLMRLLDMPEHLHDRLMAIIDERFKRGEVKVSELQKPKER